MAWECWEEFHRDSKWIEREDYIEKEKNGRGGNIRKSISSTFNPFHPAEDYKSHPFIVEITS